MASACFSGSEADLRRQKWLVLRRGRAVGDASSCAACSHLVQDSSCCHELCFWIRSCFRKTLVTLYHHEGTRQRWAGWSSQVGEVVSLPKGPTLQ